MQEINKAISRLHEAGDLEVLSFCESVPLSLVGMLPRMLVVPEETAFPGVTIALAWPPHLLHFLNAEERLYSGCIVHDLHLAHHVSA